MNLAPAILVDVNDISGVSPFNARHGRALDAAAEAELLPQIVATRGPIEPLILIRDPDRGLEVLEGRRRWEMTKLAIKRKLLPKATRVHASIFEGSEAEAREVSLMGDTKAPLHDAIHAMRFHDLAARMPAEEIAKHFGKSLRAVKQLTALGAVAPEILAAWLDGSIRRESVAAYASTSAQDEQLALFRDKPTFRDYPRFIADTLRGDVMAADEPLALYVGEAAYRAAGGRVEADLFSEESFWSDKAIAEKLAHDRLAARGAAIVKAEGWGWFKTTFDEGADRLYAPGDLEDEFVFADVDENRMDELTAELRDFTGEAFRSADRAIEIRAEMDQIEAKTWKKLVPTARRKKLGVRLSLEARGIEVVDRALETVAQREAREAKEEAEQAKPVKAPKIGAPTRVALPPALAQAARLALVDNLRDRPDLAMCLVLLCDARHWFLGEDRPSDLSGVLRECHTDAEAIDQLGHASIADVTAALCVDMSGMIDEDIDDRNLALLVELARQRGAAIGAALNRHFVSEEPIEIPEPFRTIMNDARAAEASADLAEA